MAADSTRCSHCGEELSAETSNHVCQLPPYSSTADHRSHHRHGIDETPPESKAVRLSPGKADAQGFESTNIWTSAEDESTQSHVDPAAATQSSPTSGVRLFGDYEIQRELGRGGMGFVYGARQISLNRLVALKMIKVGVLADDDELRRFQNEAESVALLDHPGIVPIYEVGQLDGQHYFSMKLIEGGNLSQRLSIFQASPQSAVPMMIGIADAVQHAHLRGILHRDLKPANILVDQDGHPHITDFGLAKRIDSEIDLTMAGAIVGTPAYMSPEQASGCRGAITTATDVYGLGAILYAMLTGAGPFRGDSVIATLDAVRVQPPEPPTRRNSNVPHDLELVCLKCLEKDPADRYASAGALAEDLRHFQAGEPVSVRAVGLMERLTKWTHRNPTLAAAHALGVLVLLLGGFGSVTYRQWQLTAIARDNEYEARKDAEKARDGEMDARAAAESARDGERTARTAAESARDGEKQARITAELLQQKVERIEHGRTMEVAYQEYRGDNLSAVLALLKQSNPALRGWEYRYLDRLCHFDLKTFTGHTSNVTAAAFNHDGTKIVTSSYDSTARIWDVSTGHVIHTLAGHQGMVMSAAFSADGSRVVSAGEDFMARVWDTRAGTLLFTFRDHHTFVNGVSFSPDGARVLSAGGDSTARVWDALTGHELLTIRSPSPVMTAAYSVDGARIVTTGGNAAHVWSATTGEEQIRIRGHLHQLASAVFSPDGTRILTASTDATAKLWDSRVNAEQSSLPGQTLGEIAASFNHDGTQVVTASQDRTAKVWDAETGELKLKLTGHQQPLRAAWFSPDAQRIVTGSTDNSIRFWDAKTGRQIQTLKSKCDGFVSEFSPDGSKVVTCGWEVKRSTGGQGNFTFNTTVETPDFTGRVWDTATGSEVLKLNAKNGVIKSAQFSSDGSRIVTASSTGEIKVWDAATGADLMTMARTDPLLASVTFNPDGTKVSSATALAAFVWDVKTGSEVLRLIGHTGPVTSTAFHPREPRIVTSSDDGTAKLWDSESGAEVFSFKLRSNGTTAAFSPDGEKIVMTGGGVIIWDASPIHTLDR